MLLLFYIFFLFQEEKLVKPQQAKSEIYIPLRGRTEVTLTPLPDSLIAGQEYKFIMELDPKYTVSDLYFDKGLAMRSGNVLTIKPSERASVLDTATFRIICFTRGNRILLYHKFVIYPVIKSFPKLPKKSMYILVNNNVLERNSSYNKSLFLSNAFLQFYEEGIDDSVIIQGITLSITNTQTQKNMFTDKGVLSKEMINEIKTLRLNSTIYLRMDVKVGRKRKSVWTRFLMKV